MPNIDQFPARSGRVIKEDGTVVNEANGVNPDGSRNVQLMGSNLTDVVTLQNTAGAAGAGVVLPTNGYGVALLAISGVFVGTITFEGQGPDGAWYTISALQRGTGAISTTANAAGLYELNVRGLAAVRANITSYTSGNITVKGQAQPMPASDHFVNAKSTIDGSNVIVPQDMQARLVNTAQAQQSQVIAPSGTNAQATWQPVPDGMSEFINNISSDNGNAGINTNVFWSEDNSTISGKTLATNATADAQQYKTSKTWFPVGGAFYKVEIFNGDTVAHTCSSNIKFRP